MSLVSFSFYVTILSITPQIRFVSKICKDNIIKWMYLRKEVEVLLKFIWGIYN